MMKILKIQYVKPELSSFLWEEDELRILCESPKPGGNEGLIYEEW